MNAAIQRGKRTGLEEMGYAILVDLGVDFVPQHTIGGKFCVDAFLPSYNTVVQFDGDYWHGRPERFPNPDARQLRRMAYDRSQDAYMAICGIHVLRFWEHDVSTQPEWVRDAIRSHCECSNSSNSEGQV